MRLGAPEARVAVLVEVLAPLALVQRVEHQCRKSVEGEQGSHRLVFVMGLGRGIMTARHEHAGVGGGEFRGVGQEQRGRDQNARLAFEDDLVHAVAVPVQGAGDAGIERGALREAAQRGDEFFAQAGVIFRDGRGVGARFVGGLPPDPGRVDLPCR